MCRRDPAETLRGKGEADLIGLEDFSGGDMSPSFLFPTTEALSDPHEDAAG